MSIFWCSVSCRRKVRRRVNKINYGAICDKIISEIENSGRRPSLLLHVCCAPCSSYVIEYLEKYFDLTLYFYNPNISTLEEYAYRLSELSRFVSERGVKPYRILTPTYDPDEFFSAVRGLEDVPEGGGRCFVCYEQRLRKTAEAAKELNFEYFTTTLSVSPYKNAEKLCQIGADLENELGIKYLLSDFKKRGGYLRSIELSSIYGLYRQNFCGCSFSEAEAEARRVSRDENII